MWARSLISFQLIRRISQHSRTKCLCRSSSDDISVRVVSFTLALWRLPVILSAAILSPDILNTWFKLFCHKTKKVKSLFSSFLCRGVGVCRSSSSRYWPSHTATVIVLKYNILTLEGGGSRTYAHLTPKCNPMQTPLCLMNSRHQYFSWD